MNSVLCIKCKHKTYADSTYHSRDEFPMRLYCSIGVPLDKTGQPLIGGWRRNDKITFVFYEMFKVPNECPYLLEHIVV